MLISNEALAEMRDGSIEHGLLMKLLRAVCDGIMGNESEKGRATTNANENRSPLPVLVIRCDWTFATLEKYRTNGRQNKPSTSRLFEKRGGVFGVPAGVASGGARNRFDP